MDQAAKPESRGASDGVIRRLAEGRTVRSIGVEEELLIIDPGTGRPRALAGAVIRAAGPGAAEPGAGGPGAVEPSTGEPGAVQPLEFELQKQQLEIDTRPCHSLDELGRELRRCRALAAAAAARAGVTVAALGTSPVAVHPEVVPTSRYQAMAAAFGLTAHEQLTCGCHVHVGISSAEEGVAVLDRIQPWLATLLALSANSPFWQGADSAYASFRYQAWGRWPSSGPTGQFGSAQAYQATVQQMIDTRTLLDPGMVYFDARLSRHYPTIEVRIADVCQHADDAVLIAALVRGLVETEARNWQAGRPARPVRTEQLRLAAWRASRDDVLIDPVTFRPDKAAAVTALLVEHVRDALADAGDTRLVTDLLDAVLYRGNGAAAQRSEYQRRGASWTSSPPPLPLPRADLARRRPARHMPDHPPGTVWAGYGSPSGLASGPATATRSGHADDHPVPQLIPGQSRKLDAAAVLTGQLLPAPLLGAADDESVRACPSHRRARAASPNLSRSPTPARRPHGAGNTHPSRSVHSP